MIESVLKKARETVSFEQNITLRIAECDDSTLFAKLDNKLYDCLEKVKEVDEFDFKANLLREFQSFSLDFMERYSETISISLKEKIDEANFVLSVYAALYESLFWLGKVERAEDEKIFLSSLYSCVDVLELEIYKMRQSQGLPKRYKIQRHIKSLFVEILDSALKEAKKLDERESILLNKVSIRRTAISGLVQLQTIKDDGDEFSWSEEEAALNSLIDLVDDWSKQDYLPEEREGLEKVMLGLQRE